MRTGYSVSKLVAFCGLGLTHAVASLPRESLARWLPSTRPALESCAWIMVLICSPGPPVIAHPIRLLPPGRPAPGWTGRADGIIDSTGSRQPSEPIDESG